jgi:parallel beta-helix repeat protein
VLSNCTITGNSAKNNGGGIYSGSSSSIFITNSIVWGNADSSGQGQSAQIYDDGDGTLLDVWFSCIQDGNSSDANVPFGTENFNIDDDPCFVLPGYWGHADDTNIPVEPMDPNALWVDGDHHLLVASPCIEAGNPYFTYQPGDVDMDAQPRLMGPRVDMGVDEFEIAIIVVSKPQGGEVWTNGSTHEINWDSYGITGTVDIYYSPNDGADWLMIDNTTDSGSFMWQLPGAVDSNQCLVAVEPNIPVPDFICIESGLFTIHPDSPGPAVVSKWKSLGGDFDRAGLSENYGPELGCIKWQFQTDAPVSASATIGADDRVHLSCEDGKVYTLDANGLLLWSYDINSPLLSSPTIGPDGTVYVGGQDEKLYAIDVNGSLRWTHNTDGFIYSSPAVSPDGNVYACSQDGTLYALGRDGSELWTFETAGPGIATGAIFASPAIGPNGTVYIAGVYDPNLYALDSNDGSVKWNCNFIDPCDPNGEQPWPFASPVIALDGTIYQTLLYNPKRLVGEPPPAAPLYEAVWYDSKLYAIDPNNGNILWATNMTETATQMEQIDPEPPEPNYWFKQYYAYAGRRPEEEGIPPYPYTATFVLGPGSARYYRVSNSSFSEPALAPDGTIYVSFDDQYLRAVDPNGTIKWVTSLGWLGGFTLTVGSDGLIYAAGDEGYLHVLDPYGNELARLESDNWLSHPVIAADGTMIISDSNNTVLALGADSCEGQIAALHRPEDLSADWAFNFIDFTVMAADWLQCTDTSYDPVTKGPYCDYDGDEFFLTGDINRDQYVNYADVAALANRWLTED